MDCVLGRHAGVWVCFGGLLPFFGCSSNPSAQPDDGELGRIEQAASRKPAKVAICHIPPDDASPRHTIKVSDSAVSAHLEHGDVLGECASGCTANEVCDDGDPCTSDACMWDGTCSHLSVSCDDSNPCTSDLCTFDRGCVNAPADGVACVDGNDCTSGDTCLGGRCTGTAIVGCCTTDAGCSDENVCTVDRCQDRSCFNLPLDCSVSDLCRAGFCDPATGGCSSTEVSCDDSNPCTVDTCDSALGCVSSVVPDGSACDDGNACTETDVCQAGSCRGADSCAAADLTPTMTSLTTPSGIVTSSGSSSAESEAWHAFDATTPTTTAGMWISALGIAPAWVAYEFTDGPRTVTEYGIRYTNGSLTARAPRSWKLEGSSGAEWITLDTQSGQIGWTQGQTRTFTIANPAPYTSYRLYVTDDNDPAAAIVVVSIGELFLNGN
jgi:hypothetical protein